MYPCLSCGGWSAYLRMVPRLSRMLSDSPMPGVNTVNGMIGISADRLGATCSASPSRVWSNDRRASVPTVASAAWTAATACSMISLAPSSSVSPALSAVCSSQWCPLCTHSSVLSWPVCGMPRKLALITDASYRLPSMVADANPSPIGRLNDPACHPSSSQLA